MKSTVRATVTMSLAYTALSAAAIMFPLPHGLRPALGIIHALISLRLILHLVGCSVVPTCALLQRLVQSGYDLEAAIRLLLKE